MMPRFSILGWWKSPGRPTRPSRRPRRPGASAPPPVTPCLELLEHRTLLSHFVVTNLRDDGSAGSLRYEVQQANANPGPDLIRFARGLHGTIALDPARGPV